MNQKKIEVGVIGLGKFGFNLAESLSDLGHDVVGLDGSMDRVRRARDTLSQVYQADGTDKKALDQLGIKDMDYVVVSVGNSLGTSILVTMNLLEMEVKKIWVKAVSEEHARVLNRLGVDFVVFPEQYVARQLAHKLAVPGLLEYLALGEGVVVRETEVDRWDGMTIMELALPATKKVQIVGIKPRDEKKFSFVPRADDVLRTGDILVLIGETANVTEIES